MEQGEAWGETAWLCLGLVVKSLSRVISPKMVLENTHLIS